MPQMKAERAARDVPVTTVLNSVVLGFMDAHRDDHIAALTVIAEPENGATDPFKRAVSKRTVINIADWKEDAIHTVQAVFVGLIGDDKEFGDEVWLTLLASRANEVGRPICRSVKTVELLVDFSKYPNDYEIGFG